jgi:hypothetical protein
MKQHAHMAADSLRTQIIEDELSPDIVGDEQKLPL